jgi:hypothetical protein
LAGRPGWVRARAAQFPVKQAAAAAPAAWGTATNAVTWLLLRGDDEANDLGRRVVRSMSEKKIISIMDVNHFICILLYLLKLGLLTYNKIDEFKKTMIKK